MSIKPSGCFFAEDDDEGEIISSSSSEEEEEESDDAVTDPSFVTVKYYFISILHLFVHICNLCLLFQVPKQFIEHVCVFYCNK